MSVKPLKRFGQNYLRDENISGKIVNELKPQKSDYIIEIGPGLGSLTKLLAEQTNNLFAVEIDKRVVDKLRVQFPGVNIIQQDFLKLDLKELLHSDKSKIRVIGNIPYNLTSPIFFKLLENSKIVSDAVMMIQYEVAKRLTAKTNTKDYGIFGVIFQFFAEVKFCFKVSPNVFYPKPKVYSAVVHLRFKNLEISELQKDFFIKVVKACFGNRRKTLKNSLSNSIFRHINFSNSGINLSARAEELSLEDFWSLAEFTRKSHL